MLQLAMFLKATDYAGSELSFFRLDEPPFYHRGLSMIAALVSLTLVMFLLFLYYRANPKIRDFEEIRRGDSGYVLRSHVERAKVIEVRVLGGSKGKE